MPKSKHSSEWNGRVYNPSFPQLGAEVALASYYFFQSCFRMEFGAREVALEAPEIFLARRRWYRRRNWQGIGEGTGVGTGDGIGPTPDLVRYRLGGFGGAASPEEELLDCEGSGAESGTGSFRRLFLRFEGDEDLAPRVRAISGSELWPTLLIGEDDRRLGRRGSLKKTNSARMRSDF
ncbi:hypothetical protein CK203_060374 [Vitis vinifera]|uniref:Uncharacterized protein n=1 Tax=Vitis vinifera TaxID=29760 RepID=A0A438FSG5_VITVI|nr:hypothetical protein CK203_060374 [Vitis vinifera]